MSVTLYLRHGDCVQVLGEHPDESMGAVVCDPPYELSFMGKGWDSTGVAYDPVLWSHLYRVLVPGGVVKAFSATRTFHRMGAAMQRAGFTALGMEAWSYGSGFPKSLDIGKAIDKHGGEDVSWFGSWFRAWREQNGVAVKQVAALFPSKQKYAGKEASGNPTGCVSNWEAGRSLPTLEQFNVLRVAFDLPFDTIEAVHREVLVERTMVQGGGTSFELRMGERREVQANITAPATEAARTWNGWGTALKPSWEPVLVGRKPLS